jgi:CRISPR-associated protein Cas5t
MLGVYVSVPIACFRKGLAREYLETEPIPPPATCYGFLLSLVGERDRRRHLGVRVSPVLLSRPEQSVVLRTVWRVKKTPLGSPGNTRPDFQQLLSGIELIVWLDSGEEASMDGPSLEQRVSIALADPARIDRFGGLSLGESTHLVNEVSFWERARSRFRVDAGQAYLLAERGRLTLPVWVDHVGSAGTRYSTGDLVPWSLGGTPQPAQLPRIHDETPP